MSKYLPLIKNPNIAAARILLNSDYPVSVHQFQWQKEIGRKLPVLLEIAETKESLAKVVSDILSKEDHFVICRTEYKDIVSEILSTDPDVTSYTVINRHNTFFIEPQKLANEDLNRLFNEPSLRFIENTVEYKELSYSDVTSSDVYKLLNKDVVYTLEDDGSYHRVTEIKEVFAACVAGVLFERVVTPNGESLEWANQVVTASVAAQSITAGSIAPASPQPARPQPAAAAVPTVAHLTAIEHYPETIDNSSGITMFRIVDIRSLQHGTVYYTYNPQMGKRGGYVRLTNTGLAKAFMERGIYTLTDCK